MRTKYTQESEKIFILIIAAIFLILSFIVIRDIFVTIIFSFILAYFLNPIYIFYTERVTNQKVSAILTLFTATLGFFLPLALLSYFLILNLVKLLLQYKVYIENPEILNAVVQNFLQKFTDSPIFSTVEFSSIFSNVVIYILNFINDFFLSIPMFLIYFFIMLFLTYYILVYKNELMHSFNTYIPLSMRKQNEIIRNIRKNLKVLFKGYFLTGLIQTIVSIFGYLLFGAPEILILSFLTLIISLIPYLGTPLIWVPVSFYMIVVGDQVNGLLLFLYGLFIISMIDNFVRPILMSDKETIAPPLVFIGFVGGILAFGIGGIILGPIIISISIILLRYVREYYETTI